jgi:hypothetical protein
VSAVEPEVSSDLRAAVARVRGSLPCSVVLPAGAGKTHLVAHLIHALSRDGGRALLLTHTNAGVDAMRRRLRALGAMRSARVRTISGWSLDLIGRLPQLSGMSVGAEPEWELSRSYVEAATRAVQAEAVQEVLRASYDVILVDEYQDCTITQHRLVRSLSAALPLAVFGDPLQALFAFDADGPPNWAEVERVFPPVHVPSAPHRWLQTNHRLGYWLVSIREPLQRGEPIALDRDVVRWVRSGDPRSKTTACHEQPRSGSVVALGRFRQDCAALAKNLRGTYAVMEELEGRVLMDFADVIDAAGDSLAYDTIEFAMASGAGLAEIITADKRRRIRAGKQITTNKVEYAAAYGALERLRTDPAPHAVGVALQELAALPRFHVCCREAWYGILDALDHAATTPGTTVRSAVIRGRNRTRVIGRRPESRVVSRPRLVKGLEYDHAVLLDADQYDSAELYVALTRARRTLTVISSTPILDPGVSP